MAFMKDVYTYKFVCSSTFSKLSSFFCTQQLRKYINKDSFFDLGSLTLFVAMCERKLFAIVSLTISLRQRKIAYHPDKYRHSFEHNNQENTLTKILSLI